MLGFGAALLCGALSYGAAQAADPPAPTPATAEAPAPAASAAACCVIPAGTIVLVELTQALSASTAKSGDHFTLRLAEPILIGGEVVVPTGATGVGEVIDAKPAGIGGRPGRLVLAARYLESGGLKLTLQSFKLGGGGRDNSGLAVGATIVVGLVGALVPGGSVDYPVGARATAKIASDVTTPPIHPAANSEPTS